jgi:CheY-like chemotaxis protein
MKEKRKILVVDDDPDCLEFARLVLSSRYEVQTVQSIGECRSVLKSKKPDLILLDVMMVHLSDGLDYSRELKESADTRDIPVIMLTNVNEVYDYSTQIETTFFPHDSWLDKPVKAEVLLKTVGDVLGEPVAK